MKMLIKQIKKNVFRKCSKFETGEIVGFAISAFAVLYVVVRSCL